MTARRWDRQARREALAFGLDATALTDISSRQLAVEAQTGLALTAYTAPTEQVVGAVFRHIAPLAECSQYARPLEQIGRIIYLLDRLADYRDDLQCGLYHALARCAVPQHSFATAQQLITAALACILQHWERMHLPSPDLARTLLLVVLPQRWTSVFHRALKTVCGFKSPLAAAALAAAVLAPGNVQAHSGRGTIHAVADAATNAGQPSYCEQAGRAGHLLPSALETYDDHQRRRRADSFSNSDWSCADCCDCSFCTNDCTCVCVDASDCCCGATAGMVTAAATAADKQYAWLAAIRHEKTAASCYPANLSNVLGSHSVRGTTPDAGFIRSSQRATAATVASSPKPASQARIPHCRHR